MANGADSKTTSRLRARPIWIAVAVVTIVVVDQLTKAWAVAALSDGPINVIGDNIRFELARNSGAAFSGFQGYTPILAILAIAITVLIARAVRRATDPWIIGGLVLGGALGNLCDRIFRSPGFLRGHVVDFVALGSFPVFNVADSCVTIGAIILVVRTLMIDAKRPKPPE